MEKNSFPVYKEQDRKISVRNSVSAVVSSTPNGLNVYLKSESKERNSTRMSGKLIWKKAKKMLNNTE